MPGLAGASSVLDISEIIQICDDEKSSSTSQLIKVKSRGLQELLNFLMEQQILRLLYYFQLHNQCYFCLILKEFSYCCLVPIYYCYLVLIKGLRNIIIVEN